MDTPLEIYVRAIVQGVKFAPIAPESVDTATVATLDGSPLPAFVQDALKRDRFAVTWTIAHLDITPGQPATAPLMLFLLGSGALKRFAEKNPSVIETRRV